jgi:hypothetical protein
MRKTTSTSKAGRLGAVLGGLLVLTCTGLASADSPPTLAEALRDRQAGNTPAREVRYQDAATDEDTPAKLAETWGIEVTSLRLTANDHMIDYRFRVLDTDKAASLFTRQVKPQLIHQETGRVLAVPDTAKVGPLRNSNTPQKDRIYWMFFGNAGNLVKPGDKITVVIGDFVLEDLVVE